MGFFVGRSEEQDRFRRVLAEVAGKTDDGPDEAYVVLVQGYGGIGKSTLLRRFADIAAGRLPETSAGRFTVFTVDWERDRDLHTEEYVEFTGPAIWRILERIRAHLENSASSWNSAARRRLNGFAAFQRHVTKLPELEAEAARLGIGKQAAHQPITPAQVAAIAKAGGEIAEVAGVPKAIIGATNTVVGAGAQIATTIQHNRGGRIDPAAYRALVDQIDALVTAFTDGLRTLARKRPVVVVLDTCELLGGSGPWLREVMRRSGRRVVWLIGTRLELELMAAGNSEAVRYQRELDERRLRTFTLHRFDDRTATSYLQQRLDSLPPDLDIGRVIALTQGVPLALHFVAKMIIDQIHAGRPMEELYEEVASDGAISNVVARMADRYLHHATYREDSELYQDLTALYGLALIQIERPPSRSHSFQPAPFREETPVAIARDPDLLAALWDIPVGDVARRLRDLGQRHDFVHSGNGTLHRDVRDAIRTFLLEPTQRAAVTEINHRAADHLRRRLTASEHTSIDVQFGDVTWRATMAALFWHTCWINPIDGVLLLRHLYPAAAVLQPSYAGLLVDLVSYFAPYCTTSDRNLLDGLAELHSYHSPGEAAQAAINALTNAPIPHPPLLHGPTHPYLHLLKAQSARMLGIDLATQVTELRRATKAFPPLSGQSALKIADIGRRLVLPSFKSQPARLQKALITGKKIAIRYQPTDSHAYLDLGRALLLLDRFDEAEAVYRKVIDLNPENVAAHNGLGNALYGLKRFDEAEAAYRQAIDLDPEYATAHNGLGNALYGLKRFDEAEAAYRQAIDLDPEDAAVHNDLGNALYGLKRFVKAEAAYRQAINLDPADAIVRSNLGGALFQTRRFNEAEAAYRQAIDLDPEYATAYNRLGNTLCRLKRYDEAEAVHRKMIDLNPENVAAHNGLGNALYGLKRFDEAEAAYRQAIDLDPEYATAHNGLGNALCDLKRFDEAEAAYRQAIDLDPEYATAHNGLGNALCDLKRFDKAEAAYRQAIDLDLADAVIRGNLGTTLLQMGRFNEAEVAFREVIALGSDSATVRSNLGYALFQMGRFSQAEIAYRQAIDLDSENATAHSGLGRMLWELGRFDDAEAVFRKAVDIDSKYIRGHRWIGALLLFAGEVHEARSELDRAGEHPDTELLRWVVDRAGAQSKVSNHNPDTVLAALDESWPPDADRPSTFATAEIRALAVAGRGDGIEAARILRSSVLSRRPCDRFVRPLYDLLASPEPVAGLEGLLDVWREIIACDPKAAGLWGGPEPAPDLRT